MSNEKIGKSKLLTWLEETLSLSLKSGVRSIAWIPIGAVVAIAAIWTYAIVCIRTEGAEARRSAAAATEELASSFSTHIAKTVHDADMVVRWVKYEYQRSPATFSLARLDGAGLVSADTAVQVTIVGADGDVVHTTAPEARSINLSDRTHFIVHKADPNLGLYISRPVIGRVSRRWTLQFTRRLDNPDGSFAGIVVVSEDPAYLTSGFASQDTLAASGMIAVLSDNGYLLSHLAGGAKPSPVGPPAAAYDEIIRGRTGVFSDPVDHVRRFVAYRHLPQYPVSVIVGTSESDALDDYRHARALYLVMASLLTVVLTIAAAVITTTMASLLEARRKMQHLAETDSLTALPNRYLLTEVVRQRIKNGLALLFVDLDNFKRINDALGHQMGDELLKNVARRLTRIGGEGAFLARVGGDEFVLVVEGPSALSGASELAQSVIDSFELAFGLRGNSYVMRVSIGVAAAPGDEADEHDLLRRADLAMYAAKEAGRQANKSTYQLYTPELSTRAMKDVERLQEIQYAIQNREFFVEYQPIVSVETGDMQGVEALVRWSHPEKGVTGPEEFIPFAEDTGFIVPIGELVLEDACAQFRLWEDSDPPGLYLSVNVSAAQLIHGDLVGTVRRCLRQYDVDPRRIKLEITETCMLGESAVVVQRLNDLRQLGIRVILDRFGSGFSSLSQLTSIVVDGVKLDRRFALGIPADRAALATFKSIASLTRELGLSLVVEGVESEEQLTWLRGYPGIEAQGSAYGRPVPPEMVRVRKTA